MNDHIGNVRLADEASAFGVMCGTEATVILNAASALEGFASLPAVGEVDKTFGIKAISKIAGTSYQLAWHYVNEGVLMPSIRPATGKGQGDVEALFSWTDAFTAGVVGSLRRHGLKLNVLRKIQPLFTKKRTARKVVTSTRP